VSARAALITRVRATLRERALLVGARHVLVACSGGPDSQALLHVLHALQGEHGCAVSAASIDHGLRADAAADVAIAGRLAQALGVPFFARRIEVGSGASRQAQARDARYAALRECADHCAADRIAVGHTLDDQAETVLARLLRGAGIDGLSAITPWREDGVVRPMIDCARVQVSAYIAAEALEAADDPSNRDPRYLRSRVRASLLPALCAENPNFARQLASLADDARQAAALLTERAASALAQAEGHAARLREEPEIVRRWALRAFVEQRSGAKLTRTHLVALDRMLSGGGPVRVPGDLLVTLDPAGVLSVSRVTKRGRGLPRQREGTGES
jgi:tRNA(Ile)-lysidine synthase